TTLNGPARDEYCRQVTYMCNRAEVALWPALTAHENVQLPLAATPTSAASLRLLAGDLLGGLGLSGRESRRPTELTPAERRRLVPVCSSPTIRSPAWLRTTPRNSVPAWTTSCAGWEPL